jgi:hypothetical protein
MPIHKITQNGKTYYRYGDSGKMYTNRADAEKQAAAIHAAGYVEPIETNQSMKKDSNK